LLPGEPHRVIEGAVRCALRAFGGMPAGQLGLAIGLGVHWTLPCVVPARIGAYPRIRLAGDLDARVWPNRGAAGRDFYSDVNVLALLQLRNSIDDWLTSNITPRPHRRPNTVMRRETPDRIRARRAPSRSTLHHRRQRCCRSRPRRA